ncbi:MAG: 50S ribosomal protein L21e [Candidatus Bathyarchaeia archaeon]
MGGSSGYRRKSRQLLKKPRRESGKIGLSRILHEYKTNDKVYVTINPSIHKGMPHRRFQGKVGIIRMKRGRSYLVTVPIGGSQKTVIVRPEHLKPFEG